MARSKHSFGFKSSLLYFHELVENFGLKFVLLMTSVSFGLRGALRQFVVNVELPFYMFGGWNSTIYSSNMAISNAPMTLKGICGILSDILPFGGYEKSCWFLIYTLLGISSCSILAIFHMENGLTPSWIPPILFFCMQMQSAFSELLAQAKYVEIMNTIPKSRGNIVTFSYFCMTFGEVFPHIIVGYLSERWDIRYLFVLFLPFTCQPLMFLFTGCLINDRVAPHRNNRLDLEKLKSQGKVISLAFLIFTCCLGTVVCGLFFSPNIQFTYAILVSVICISYAFYGLPKVIAKIITYIFISEATYLNIQGALEYFYTTGPECIENGPNFTMVYFKTVAGLASVVAKLIALIIFQAYLTHLKYQVSFMLTTVIRVVAATFDIVLVKRWNLAIGISDMVVHLFGFAVISEMSYMLDHMPALLIMAKLCPKFVEGTVFAVLASFGNFGQNVARFSGVFLLNISGIILQESGPCNTNNLDWIITIAHIILPLLSIPLIYILVPPIYVQDDIAEDAYANSKYLKKQIVMNRVSS